MDESSQGNLWRVIEHSTTFEAKEQSTWAIEYSTWAHDDIQFLLSMSKEGDICAVLRGAQRPTAMAESSSIANSMSIGGGDDDNDHDDGDHNNDAGQNEGPMTNARWDRASSRLHSVLYLTTTGLPRALVKRHGGNDQASGSGNEQNGQAAWKELKAKYASRRVIRDALNNTQMSVGQDPDEYLNTLHQLRTDLQKEHREVVPDGELEFIVIKHLTEEYEFMKERFFSALHPEFDLRQMEATMQRDAAGVLASERPSSQHSKGNWLVLRLQNAAGAHEGEWQGTAEEEEDRQQGLEQFRALSHNDGEMVLQAQVNHAQRRRVSCSAACSSGTRCGGDIIFVLNGMLRAAAAHADIVLDLIIGGGIGINCSTPPPPFHDNEAYISDDGLQDRPHNSRNYGAMTGRFSLIKGDGRQREKSFQKKLGGCLWLHLKGMLISERTRMVPGKPQTRSSSSSTVSRFA